MKKPLLTRDDIDRTLRLLGDRMELHGTPAAEIVACGGAALLLADLVDRKTVDVDVVALVEEGRLKAPTPMPPGLMEQAREVAEERLLASDWLNNGPSSNIGGLFQMGLPDGLENRVTRRPYRSRLTVSIISRIDLIFFKLYAAVDRPNSRHTSDLRMLAPTADELEAAGRWCLSHDVSEGFRQMLVHYLAFIMKAPDAADRFRH